MYPHERSLVKHLAGKPFALVGINSDNDVSIPQKLVQTGQVTWRSFQNESEGRKISDEWAVQGWPTIYLLDPEGKIRYVGHGEKLDENLAQLMEEIGEEFPLEEIEATAREERERKFGDESKG